jgi:hypothetical protein
MRVQIKTLITSHFSDGCCVAGEVASTAVPAAEFLALVTGDVSVYVCSMFPLSLMYLPSSN